MYFNVSFSVDIKYADSKMNIKVVKEKVQINMKSTTSESNSQNGYSIRYDSSCK